MKQISVPHLLLTVIITVISVVAAALLGTLLTVVLNDPFHTSPVRMWQIGLLVYVVILILALFVLFRLRRKARMHTPNYVFSYNAAAVIVFILFIWAAYEPVTALFDAQPSDKRSFQEEMELQKNQQFIEQYIKETTLSDSLSREQLDRIGDSLQQHWMHDTAQVPK